MPWLTLCIAGLFEVGFTTSLKLSDGFSKTWPSISFLVCASISFVLLNKAMKDIPLGTAYAVWTGIGAFGTALVGIVAFRDPVSFWRVFFLLVLIGAIVGLKLVSGEGQGTDG